MNSPRSDHPRRSHATLDPETGKIAAAGHEAGIASFSACQDGFRRGINPLKGRSQSGDHHLDIIAASNHCIA
jgi:hypothetical protein